MAGLVESRAIVNSCFLALDFWGVLSFDTGLNRQAVHDILFKKVELPSQQQPFDGITILYPTIQEAKN